MSADDGRHDADVEAFVSASSNEASSL